MQVSPFEVYGRRGISTMEVVEMAALRQFLERGFEATTADDIARAADLSTRTFFRYFPRGKEDVMVLQFRRWMHQLEKTMRERPPHESAWTAIRESVRMIPLLGGDRGLSPEAVALHLQVARANPDLHATLTGNHLALAEPLVHIAALRMSVDPAVSIRPRLMIHAMLSAAMLAWLSWLANPQLDAFARFEDALNELETGFGA